MDGHRWQKCRKNSKVDFELNKDFLSSMPPEIIENILVKLPIKEAVRTSILSSKWRYSWASIPDLVFNEYTTQSKLIESVDKVLQAHQGPILKFELEQQSIQDVGEAAINRWLLILSQNVLKDLRLSFHIFKDGKVPSSLFSYYKLEIWNILNFFHCTVYAPQCFQGLKLLRNLKLSLCQLVGITIEKFVSSYPLLESLDVLDFGGHGCFTIRAPNLKRLNLQGAFTNLSLETPKLICASIWLSYNYQYFSPVNCGCKSKLLCTLGQLSNIEMLEMGLNFCEYLASGSIPEKLPVTFHHLKKISVDLQGRSKEVEAALGIFRNSPILKTLHLWLPCQNIWEGQRIAGISLFNQLEVVNILGFKEAVSMLGFAKFIQKVLLLS